MRTIIDQNERFLIAKVVDQKFNVNEYQVCDKSVPAGHKGFVVDTASILAKAREIAGIPHRGSGVQTKPKSAYPEQQTGFKRQTKGVKRKGKIV